MNKEYQKAGNRLYFMNDRNIRDGLLTKRVKSEHIIKVLLDKGIIVPEKCSKDTLIDIVKKVRFDYFDYIYLSSLIENPDRKDSQSTTGINKKCTTGDLNLVFNEIKKSAQSDEIDLNLNKITSSKSTIDIDYFEVDYSKTPMRQRSRKKGVIEIEVLESGETNIIYPATKVGRKIKDHLVSGIKNRFDDSVDTVEIDFKNSSTEQRNKFFTSLINLPNYEVFDVVSVSVRNNKGEEEESDFTGQVRKAALSGKEVLASSIYTSFSSSKYSIYKISWKIRVEDGSLGAEKSDCYTVEAKFDDSEKSMGFSYQVKAVQRFSENRGVLNSSPDKMGKDEIEKVSKIIYNRAVSLYNELVLGA